MWVWVCVDMGVCVYYDTLRLLVVQIVASDTGAARVCEIPK